MARLIVKIVIISFRWLREKEKGIFSYVAQYFGMGPLLFDMYLQNPSYSFFGGKETFTTLINNFIELGLFDVSSYTRHLEFRTYDGQSLGNVYTVFRAYYADFGLAGLYIMHGLFSLIFSWLYEKIKKLGR